jgi:hypothetical protein
VGDCSPFCELTSFIYVFLFAVCIIPQFFMNFIKF